MCFHPDHPLLISLVNTLRDVRLNPLIFRHTIGEIAKLLLYEAMREFPLSLRPLPTWRGEFDAEVIDEGSLMIVSVLRAALPMHEALIEILPYAESGFLGIKRDEESHQSRLYYDRLGECQGKTVVLVDTMVATGGSACDAIEIIKRKGGSRIIALHILASPEGIEAIAQRHPDVEMVVAQIDRGLDGNKFIIPGLGDAGDRAYNTF